MLTPLWVYGNTQSCEINEKFLKVEAGNGKCVALIFIHYPPVSLVNRHVYFFESQIYAMNIVYVYSQGHINFFCLYQLVSS